MPRSRAVARARRRKAKRVGIVAPDSVSCRNASPKSRTGAPSNPVKILEQFCQMVGWTLSYKKWNAEQDQFAEIEIIGRYPFLPSLCTKCQRADKSYRRIRNKIFPEVSRQRGKQGCSQNNERIQGIKIHVTDNYGHEVASRDEGRWD